MLWNNDIPVSSVLNARDIGHGSHSKTVDHLFLALQYVLVWDNHKLPYALLTFVTPPRGCGFLQPTKRILLLIFFLEHSLFIPFRVFGSIEKIKFFSLPLSFLPMCFLLLKQELLIFSFFPNYPWPFLLNVLLLLNGWPSLLMYCSKWHFRGLFGILDSMI